MFDSSEESFDEPDLGTQESDSRDVSRESGSKDPAVRKSRSIVRRGVGSASSTCLFETPKQDSKSDLDRTDPRSSDLDRTDSSHDLDLEESDFSPEPPKLSKEVNSCNSQ